MSVKLGYLTALFVANAAITAAPVAATAECSRQPCPGNDVPGIGRRVPGADPLTVR